MKVARFITLAFTPALLMAQAPAPASSNPASPQAPASPSLQTLAKRTAAEQPEIERLISSLMPRDALAKVEALLPTAPEPFAKDDLKSALDSYQGNRALEFAYSLAGRAAFAAGYWEKSLDYYNKARDTAKSNYEDSQKVLGSFAESLRAAIVANKKTLEENEAYIKELQAKANPDPGEKQQLDLVKTTQDTIVSNEKWAKILDSDIEIAKKDVDYFAAKPEETDGWIKKEADQLATYRYPNDKVKFVEGIISNKKFLQQFQDKQSEAEYLHRLNVLDPNNKKVLKEIEILQGKAEAEKPATKKKG